MNKQYSLLFNPNEDNSYPRPTCSNLKGRTIAASICFLCLSLLLFLCLSVPRNFVAVSRKHEKVVNIYPPAVEEPVADQKGKAHSPVKIWAGPARSRRETVTIFAATKWYGEDFMKPDFVKQQCSPDIQKWCRITTSSNESTTADAVLFHNRDFNQSFYPAHQNLSQVYVMMTAESPTHEEIQFLPDQINWTMTYRMDSDIDYRYFVMRDKEKHEESPYNYIWNMKNSSLTAAWIATNCNSANKREEVVKKAQNASLSIDIFGSCGKKLEKCDRFAPNRDECAAGIMKTYKFYIAFENSNCPDYVTEKLYKAFNLYYAVPIVLERKLYEDFGVPPDAFIALDDFNSIEEMAEFINELKNDKERYIEYHKWRKTYEVKQFDDNIKFCDLCQKLRNGGQKPQSYTNLEKWFSKEACDNSATDRYL